MAIRITRAPGQNMGLQFKEHDLAHKLLDGKTGVECGAASHNSFGLAGSVNVAPKDDYEFYKNYQIGFSGGYAEVDHFAEADNMPFDYNSQDYVISSHAVEHFPDLIGAFREWNRVLKDGGIVFMIIPLRHADPKDVNRPLSDLMEIAQAHLQRWTPDTIPEGTPASYTSHRGHYWVLTPEIVREVVRYAQLDWKEIAHEDVDTKVGNGFTLVYEISKPAKAAEPVTPKPPRRKQAK